MSSTADFSLPRIQFYATGLFTLSALLFVLTRLISGVTLDFVYAIASLAAVASNGLAIKKSLIRFAWDMDTMDRLLSSIQFPYFLLAVFFWFTKDTTKFTLHLLPLIILSAYQIIEYIPSDAGLVRHKYWRRYGKQIGTVAAALKPRLIAYAGNAEVGAFFILLLSLITLRANLLHVIFFIQYLRWQYNLSPAIRVSLQRWDAAIKTFTTDPRCPQILKVVNVKVREYLNQADSFTRMNSTTTVSKETKKN